jgi:hypothetical protein
MKKIAAVGLLICWSLWCYGIGSWMTQKRWEKATAEIVWHCVQGHWGAIQRQRNSPDEKASIVPTEEDKRAGEHPCDNATIFWYDRQTGEHFKTCEEPQ